MDQLRTALIWLKRHHFWVLCGLVAIIAFGSWAKASGKLSTLFATNQTAIKSEFDNVKKLLTDPFHPNEDVNTKQQAQTKQLAADVQKLWQQLYDRQREHVLEWPTELAKDFRDNVDKLQFGAEIRSDLRNHYQNYIENHFPTLPKRIDARPIDPNAMPGSPGGGPEVGPSATNQLQDDNDYICLWSSTDQAVVREDLNFRQQPSSLKIWVTQENLWVYETLLDIIAKTNRAANATRMSNAAIPEIGELSLGLRAARGSHAGHLLVQTAAPTVGGAGPEAGGPGSAGPGAPGGPGSPEGGAGARMEFSPGAGPNNGPMTDEQEKAYLLSGRYLNSDGKPAPFGGGGGAPAGDTATPAPAADPAAAGQPLDLSAFGVEYKRLPVRMALRMNQRWLPRLIAECANQPLQVEVQEVRINPPEGINGSAAGAPGGYRMGEGGPGGGASVFADEAAIQPFPTQTEMVNVIIQGSILIFNKPPVATPQTPGEQPAGAQPPPTSAAATP